MIVWVLCAAEVAAMTGFAAFAALLPGFMDEWALSNTEAGWISGVYFAAYMVCVPVLVSLTDRIDARRVFLWGAVTGGIASFGFALLADGFWSAMVWRAMAGIGLAGTYMPGLKALTDRTGGDRQSRYLAIYTSCFGVGAAVSLVLVGEAGAVFGWQTAFIAAATGSVVAILLIWFGINPVPPEHGAAPTTHLLDFRPVFRNRLAMGYVFAYAAHMWELFAQRAWLVAYLVFAMSLQPGAHWLVTAPIAAALVNLIGVPASILGNEAAMRFGRRRMVGLIMAISALASAGIGFAAGLPPWLLLTLCLLYGITCYADSAALTAGAVAAAEPRYRGATMAVHSFFGFGCSFLGPLVFGIVLDVSGGGQAGWGFAFLSLGIAVTAGPLILFLSRER